MPLWLILIVVGVVLAVVGVAVEAAKLLLWLGIIVLVAGLVMSLLRRGASRL